MASINEPYNSELVFDVEFEELVAAATKRPAMYIGSSNYHRLLGFVDGFNTAKAGGPLQGLHQWMVVKLNGGNNCAWTGMVLDIAGIEKTSQIINEDEHKEAIQALGMVLAEFFEYRHKFGLTKIFRDYGQWLLAQEWYAGPLRG